MRTIRTASDKQYIAEHYAMRRKVGDLPPMPPGYNITPGTFQPVVRLDEETSEREMVLMEWGLVPYWSNMHKMVSNCARDDKLTSNGAWIKPFQRRRCLIPGEFFYEWVVLTPEEKRQKVTKPWAVALKDNRLFSFGGIWASGTGGRIEPPAMSWKALPSEQWTRMSS